MADATTADRGTFLTREDLARELKVSVHTIDSWRSIGRLPEPAIAERERSGSGRVRVLRWTRRQIDDWVAGGCRATGGGRRRG